MHRLSDLHSKNEEDLLSQKTQWMDTITQTEKDIEKTQLEIESVSDLLAKSASNKDSYHRMRDLVSSVKQKIQDNLSTIQFFTDNDS